MQKLTNTQIKRWRILTAVLAIAWAVVIFIFSAIPGDSYPKHPGFLNYFAHFGEYLILGSLLTVALTGGKLKSWQIILIAIVITSAYAASDELHQLFVPGRFGDPVDWLTDTLGASAGALLTGFLLRRADTSRK